MPERRKETEITPPEPEELRPVPRGPKLLDRLSDTIRAKRYSPKTEQAYRGWVLRYVRYHGTRHPAELGVEEINRFLTHLAVDVGSSAATQSQARAAILFLYREVLKSPIESLGRAEDVVQGKTPRRLPVVLTRGEVGLVLRALKGMHQLIAATMYGSGLRVSEGLGLRVKDLDLERREVTVRGGKGGRDRVSMIPASMVQRLEDQLAKRRAGHERDLAEGGGWAILPGQYAKKAPRAGFEIGWQFLFPSSRGITDPRTGAIGRRHLHPTAVQRAVKAAGRTAGIAKRVTCHTFRHSFATHLLEDGYDIRTIQELLGHRSVKTTMIYTHVLNQGGMGVRSPLDSVWIPPEPETPRSNT